MKKGNLWEATIMDDKDIVILDNNNVDVFFDRIYKRAEKNNALYSMEEICDIVDKIREKKTDDNLCCV